MISKSRRTSPRPVLGEIETEIVGMQYHKAKIHPGEQINLEREPKTPTTGVRSGWRTAIWSRWAICPRAWLRGWPH